MTGVGRVGPNAVLQLAAALRTAPHMSGAAEHIFASAGLADLLVDPPDTLIDETIPARLFAALWRDLPGDMAEAIARDAGRRTGAYVLRNRIPPVARLALRLLPPRIATRRLLGAIGRHAWTFAGSGLCHVAWGPPASLTITRNPLATPGGAWHIGVIEYLFQGLVRAPTRVRHVSCRIDGEPACRFEIVQPATARPWPGWVARIRT